MATVEDLLGPRPSTNTVEDLLGPKPDPVAPVPRAFINRFPGLTKSAKEGKLEDKDETSRTLEGLKMGWGEQPWLEISPENEKWLRDNGFFNAEGENYLSWITLGRQSLEVGAEGTLGTLDYLLRGLAAGTYGAMGAAGDVVEGISGSKEAGDYVAGAGKELVDVASLYPGFGQLPVMRPTVVKGAPVLENLGPLPVESDFGTAAKAMGDPGMESLVRSLYNEKGLLPAEVAQDAAQDVTIFQDLVLGKTPEAYGGEFKITPEQQANNTAQAMVGAPTAAKATEPVTFPNLLGASVDELKDIASQVRIQEESGFERIFGSAEVAKKYRTFNEYRLGAHTDERAEYWANEIQKLVDTLSPEQQKALDDLELQLDRGDADAYQKLANVAWKYDYSGEEVPIDKVISHAADAILETNPEYLERALAGKADLFEQANVLPFLRTYDHLRERGVSAKEIRNRLVGELTASYGDDAAEIVDRTLESLTLGRKKAQESPQTASGQLAATTPAATSGATPEPSSGLPQGIPYTINIDGDAVMAGSGGGGKLPPPKNTLPAVPFEPGGNVKSAQEAILSKVSIGDHDPKAKWSFESFYTAVVDDLNPVNVAVKQALSDISKKTGATLALETADNPYDLFRLTRGTFGKADQMLLYGTFDFYTYASNGKSLKAILKPVSKDMNGLRAYIVSKRALELDAKGIETGMDIEAAKRIANDPEQKRLYGGIQQELVDYSNRLALYLRDSGLLSHASYDALVEANKHFVPFKRWLDPEINPLTGGLPGSGRRLGTSGSPIKKIKGSELDIVDPIESIIRNTYQYIALAEKNAAGVKLVDLLKAADQNGSYLVDLITPPEKPKVGTPKRLQIGHNGGPALDEDLPLLEGEVLPPESSTLPAVPGKFLELVREEDATPEAVWEEVASVDGQAKVTTNPRKAEGDTITVFKDGKKLTYRVKDKDLLKAWRGLDQWSANMITKILAAPASLLRAGATLTPDFVIKNVFRDTLAAFINTKGGIFSPLDTLSGAKSLIAKDESFQNWLKGGGANGTLVSLDRKYLQENLLKLNKQTGFLNNVWNVTTLPFTGPLRGMRIFSELVENATRLGEAKKVMGANPNKAMIQKGAFAGREITLDFARVGAQMRGMNLITAFFNAGVQDIDRIARAFKTNPVGTSLKVAAGITAPSVLLWWANHEDPRYKELPDWQKDLFWIVLTDNHIYRIPKPFTLGVLFGSGPERMMESYFGENPKALEGFSTSIAESMVPSVVPTFAVPFGEQYANRSFFSGDPLVPDRLEKLLPEYQYEPYTSQTAKEIAKLMGAFPGMRDSALDQKSLMNGVATAITSPVILENYVKAWTGGVGNYILKLADASLERSGIVPPSAVRPEPKPIIGFINEEMPFIKSFTVRYPSATVQSIQDFYNRNEQNSRVMDTLTALGNAGDLGAWQKVQENYHPRAVMDDTAQTLSDLSKFIRAINDSPEFSAQEKRQLIDTAYFNMISIAQEANKILDEMDKVLAEPSN